MKRYDPTVKHYGGCDMCSADTIEAEDGDYILFKDYEKEKTNGAKPTLSEVFAKMQEESSFDEQGVEFVALDYVKQILSGYFA